MTRTIVKQKIIDNIIDEVTEDSISPSDVGVVMQDVVDLLPNLILSYEGLLDSVTVLVFKEEVLNIYKVVENFTYQTTVLKIGNVVGINSSNIVILAKNESLLSQFLLDALNNAANPSASNPFLTQSVLNAYNGIKKINTTIIPDINGNAIIPDASLNIKGLVSASGTTQTFGGRKIIKGDGNTSNSLNSFEIQNSLGVIGIRVADNNWFTANDRSFFPLSVDIGGDLTGGTNGGRIDRNGNKLVFGDKTLISNRLNIDLLTGNICLGQTTSQDTTNARLEVISINKVSVPFPKMTDIQRQAISGISLVVGGGVYVTDLGINEGIWIYKSTGWNKLI